MLTKIRKLDAWYGTRFLAFIIIIFVGSLDIENIELSDGETD